MWLAEVPRPQVGDQVIVVTRDRQHGYVDGYDDGDGERRYKIVYAPVAFETSAEALAHPARESGESEDGYHTLDELESGT